MSTSMRKRSGSCSKRSKIVQMYDVLIKAEDPQASPFEENFWSNFFLLKPKIGHLESEVEKLTPEQFVACRPHLNRLFEESLASLGCRSRPIRVIYALQTLCGLIKAVFKKCNCVPTLCPDVDVAIGSLFSLQKAELRMQELLNHLNSFLTGEHPPSLKELCLKLLLILCCGMDNPSRNPLLEYVMIDNCLFEGLVHLLTQPESRMSHGQAAILILAILVQYRKYESNNPFAVKLSILDEELSLHGYSQVITNTLAAYNAGYECNVDQQAVQSSGWLSSITNMVGNMFVSDEGHVHSARVGEDMRARNAVLLALYEAIHLNRNFIATLAHYQTEEENPVEGPVLTNVELDSGSSAPSNLLVTFLEYCSIVMQDIKAETSRNTVKLIFLILVCISEDEYANALLSDPNLVFKVRLHRAPTRHRKPQSRWDSLASQSRPLACSVMDLMVDFLRSHMMKWFPNELYTQALSVIQRLLSYQKRSRVRLNYHWKELWTSLIGVVKFLTSNDLVKKFNVFSVVLQVIVIFNLFITYGDTFLPAPSSYDELYYELVRCRTVFDGLYSMALRHATTGSAEYKETAVKVTGALINIRAITAHFSPKINAWLAEQQLSTPSEDQILEVVKANYDSLTLKLQDSLDQYDRYSEPPEHTAFFISLVRDVIADTRNQIVLTDLQLQSVLQDFSTIQ